MATVGSAEYLLEIKVQGASEAANAFARVAQSSRQLNSAGATMGAVGRGQATRPGFGVSVSAAPPDLASQRAAATSLGSALGAPRAPAGGGVMKAAEAAKRLGQGRRQLEKLAQQMASDVAGGRSFYSDSFIAQVQGLRANLGEAEAGLPGQTTTAGNVRKRMGVWLNDQVFQPIQDAVEEGTKQRAAGMAGEQAASNLKRAARNAVNADKESLFGRGVRAATWVMPMQGYLLASALTELGAPMAMVGLGSVGLLGGMLGLGVASQLALMSRQSQLVAGMTAGGSGSTPTPMDQAFAGQLASLGLAYSLNQSDTFKLLQQLQPFNVGSRGQMAGILDVGLQQSQASQITREQGVQLAATLITRLGLSSEQATEQLVRFNAAAGNAGASLQTASEDLLQIAPYLAPGADLTGIAGLTAAARPFGITGAQFAGGLLAAQGGQRLVMASMLGLSADQMQAMQQTTGGQAALVGRLQQAARNALGMAGGNMSVAEMILQGEQLLPNGVPPDRFMQMALAGNPAAMMQLAGQTPAATPAQAAAAHRAAVLAGRAGTNPLERLQLMGQSFLEGAGREFSAVTTNPRGEILPGPLGGAAAAISGLIAAPFGGVGQVLQDIQQATAQQPNAPASLNIQIAIDPSGQYYVKGASTSTTTPGFGPPQSANIQVVGPPAPGAQMPAGPGR